MKVRYRLFVIFLAILAVSCLDDNPEGIFLSSTTFNFNEDLHGWEYGFAQYPAGAQDSISYDLKFAYPATPPGLAVEKAVMLSGKNQSGSLFMFLKKKLTGLTPNTYYTITFNVEFASNVAKGNSNANTLPAENVFVKVGATQIEPKSVVRGGNFEMNIDKGDQRFDGEDMIIIGDISSVKDSDEYVLVTRSNSGSYNRLFEVESNSDGELWLIVGTDSGFEGTTTLYYTKINAVLSSPN